LSLPVIAALLLIGLVAIKTVENHIPRFVYQSFIVVALGAPVLFTIYAMWRLWDQSVGWTELALFVVLYVLTGFGTTIGLHRLLTHRSFETPPVVRLTLLIFGAMANQGRPIDWAANHLKHHAHSDKPGDPHSPLDGMFHAHMGWILTAPRAERERYCRHLIDDPFVAFVDRTAMLWLILGLAVPYLIDGWNGFLWGGIVRMTFGNHVVFAVNSICHSFGSQPFETRDGSRNCWWVALLAFGEGWHNNHHAFPSMAFHGMSVWQVDASAELIRLLARLGLAWNVKKPSLELVNRRRRASAMPLALPSEP
jgi:stearoyl-CoA desaturase (Delta-9 desaturase)